MASLDETIAGWVQRQAGYWVARRPVRAAAAAEYRRLNAAAAWFYVFEFFGDTVRIAEKPEGAEARAEYAARAELCRAWFARAASAGGGFEGVLGMSMRDQAHPDPRFPFFAFQKPIGGVAILVPDSDALESGFYAGVTDTQAFGEKLDKAVFAGATTGGMHTYDSVEDMATARLRAGVWFRAADEVDFSLPRIVQCVDEEAAAAIRNLGFGGAPVPWEVQLGYKFLIAMDGNGAACARQAMALASNAAVLRYESPYELYYSAGLEPAVHYVPIRRELDVVAVVRMERKAPGRFARVAENGRRFFEALLTEEPALAYTAQVLAAYFGAFSDAADEAVVAPEAVPMPGVAHIARLGDVRGDFSAGMGERGSGLAIEGFQLAPPEGLSMEGMVLGAAESGWREVAGFMGSRGEGRGLTGFALRLTGAAADAYRCRYFGSFVGGAQVGPVADGDLCQSDGAALERVVVEVVAAG